MDSTPFNIPEHITQRYRDPARHYHNLDHITHMLNLIPPNHPHERELTYATWFHDCVYDPTAKHGANEKDSIKHWENYVEEQAGEDLKDVCLPFNFSK
jgi:predicted metal-dependent HD superfamily phosphohydrolase